MEEHVSYAMRNTEAVESLVFLNAPSALLDWSFLAIEAIIVVGMVTAVVHALRHRRLHGHSSALLLLGGCITYGLLMDISSYYTVENFWHGEFSVMLLHNRLPLYIVFLYPAVIYHAVMTIRRFEFSPLVEAASVGFYAGAGYAIFDNLGPLLQWWIWDRSDPTTWPYLSSVPVTSYHWMFLFTGVFSLLARPVCWDWVAQGRSRVRIGVGFALLPLLTVIIGALLFIPYNLFARNGMLELAGAYHAVLFAAAGGLFLFRARRPRQARDELLMLFPFVYLAGLLAIWVAKFDLHFAIGPDGLTADGLAAGNLVVAIVALVGCTAILLAAHPPQEERAGGD